MSYSAVYVFGDSLVDAGNALKLAQWYGTLTLSDLPDGAPTADKGYFNGRFTNGYTFADLVTNTIVGTPTKPIFPYRYEDPWLGLRISPFSPDPTGNNLNFAYGGAQIRQGKEVVPDLDGQTDAFRNAVDGRADPNALYMITMGGNDVRSLAPASSNPSQADAYGALRACAQQMLHELTQLIEMGAQNIMITGIPDVGLIPNYDRDQNGKLEGDEITRSNAATDYSVYLDGLIRTQVVPALQEALIARGIDPTKITYVPIMGPDYVDVKGKTIEPALEANLATIEALNGLQQGELLANLLQHQKLLFFDQIHPSAQAHALVGAYMASIANGTPWIETLPLSGSNLNYALKGAIATVGEVDKVVLSLVAGTTYTLDILGISSLGTAGSLGDPAMRLLGPTGTTIQFAPGSGNDSGAGFDGTYTFTATSTGLYTVEIFATGALTGNYVLQAGVVNASQQPAVRDNLYIVSSSSTGVIEGVGGGNDTVRASVSYALSAGSEVELLTTTNAKGTSSINLTGSDYAQRIEGNAGANRLDGKAGADTLFGGGGKDTFVFSNLEKSDTILDFARGDKIDVSSLDANVALAGNQAFTFIGSKAFTGQAGQLRYDGTSVQADINGDGIADFAVLLTNHATLSGADFIL